MAGSPRALERAGRRRRGTQWKTESDSQRSTLVMQPDRHKDVAEVDELMRIRHFLERSNAAGLPSDAQGSHLLVVINHREARIYQAEFHGSVPERITPLDPQGLGRHLHSV